MAAVTTRKLTLVRSDTGQASGAPTQQADRREEPAQAERSSASRKPTRYTADPQNTPGYRAVCCRIGCAWQSEQCTPDKLEAIRAGRQHEQECRPQLHITTVVDSLIASAA